MKVVLASKNPHKLVEIRQITDRFGFELVLQSELGVDIDVEETGTTFEENSLLKAKAVMEATGLPALADDSGIAVDALNGEPGVYSARYAGGHDDADNNKKLLEKMKDVPDEKRTGHFVSVIACVFPDGTELVARGECPGKILWDYRGNGGFGYDPLFLYEPMDKTFAEMNAEEKNGISHRANAMAKFAVIFAEEINKRKNK